VSAIFDLSPNPSPQGRGEDFAGATMRDAVSITTNITEAITMANITKAITMSSIKFRRDDTSVKVSSLRDFLIVVPVVRKLKHTVNKASSPRDFSNGDGFTDTPAASIILAPAKSSPLPCGEGSGERSTSDLRKPVQSSSSIIFIINFILFICFNF
jgi:hypothetical protein